VSVIYDKPNNNFLKKTRYIKYREYVGKKEIKEFKKKAHVTLLLYLNLTHPILVS
jgi:hypothetical protein